MNNNRGQNITEFIIILAVLVLAAVVSLTFLGKQVNQLLGGSEKKYSTFVPFGGLSGPEAGSGTLSPGSLGGKETAPITRCNGNLCDIDYGTFALTGIPANFSNFVETSGSAAGTDKIASILEQIASQIQSTQPEQSKDLKALANYSHVLAYLQKQTEQKAQDCSSQSDPSKCFRMYLYSPLNKAISLPAEYKAFVPNFETDQGSVIMNAILSDSELSQMRYDKLHVIDQNHIKSYPSLEIINTFDKIQEPGYNLSSSIKDITKELYLNINSLGEMMSGLSQDVVSPGSGGAPYIDPITGVVDISIERESYKTSSMEDITNPKIATQTQGKASVICITGRNTDNGNKCN